MKIIFIKILVWILLAWNCFLVQSKTYSGRVDKLRKFLALDEEKRIKSDDVDAKFIDDEWILGSNYLPDLYDIPTLSNGHIGFVINGDSIFMNGLYNGRNGQSHRARIPNFSNINIKPACIECAYQLHLEHGYFESINMSQKRFKISQETYAHRYYNRVIVNRIFIERVDGNSEEAVELVLNPGKESSEDLKKLYQKELKISGAPSLTYTVIVSCYETVILEDPMYQKQPSTVCVAYNTVPSTLNILASENNAEYIHFTAISSTEDEVTKELKDILEVRSGFSYKSFFDKHKTVWEHDMSKYEITVDGNKHLNQVIHSSLFYLISSLPSEETNQPNGLFYGLSPSGLAKGSNDMEYNGHSFWDTEIWMHPPILLLNPKWSEELLNYRYFKRQAAEDYSKTTKYKGYRYPWESAFTGRETCPEWAWEVIEYQHHITADIAFAFRSHLAATHDIDWWNKHGCDVAVNTAEFWISRAEFNETTRFYDIKSVMGPDEDHWDINNNVYTNVIAAMNLYLADFAVCSCQGLDVTEKEAFAKIARSLKLVYDKERDYHPQFEGYKGDRIKQADVALVSYPLQLPMNDSTKRNNLIIYENVTRSTGPAMTWSMHTIGFLDIRDQANAAKMFDKSYSVYNHEPFKTWSENQPGTEGSGNFITGVGGFLQSVINGYGGIRLHFDYLSITNFYNPPHTRGLSLKGMTYLNNRFNLDVKDDKATVVLTDVSKKHLIKITLKPSNREYEVRDGLVIVFGRDEELIMKAATNPFGICEMKETVLGKSDGVVLKMSAFGIALIFVLSVVLCDIQPKCEF